VSFSALIEGDPNDLADFNILWFNLEGEEVGLSDFFFFDEDLLLDSRIEDNGNGTYRWSFDVHFYTADFDIIADFAALIIYGEDDTPSNLELADDLDDTDYYGPFADGETGCDSDAFYSQCGRDLECNVTDTCEAGSDGELFIDELIADSGVDTLDIMLTFEGDNFLAPYALVLFGVDLDDNDILDENDDAIGGFVDFDDLDDDGLPDAIDNGDGTATAFISFTGMAELFAAVYPDGAADFSDLLFVGVEIYDVSEKAYAEAVP
jgi:hypothetical protein